MMDDPVEVIERQAARILLMDCDDRLLLFKCRAGVMGGDPFWITPGGGLLDGETHEQAAVRELYEEVGLAGVQLGAAIWNRIHTFPWDGRQICQRERFFLCRAPHTDVCRTHNEPEEINDLLDHRWWTIDDITSSAEHFAPRRLGQLARNLLSYGPPPKLIDVGV